MTREFNKRQRNDSRPSFRTQPSSGRYNQGQPPRASRLSRETVDRGWEKGAPRLYPDTRQRGNNRQASSPNWRNNERPGYASPNGARGNNPRSDRKDYQRGNAQHFERDNQRSHPRSFETHGRHFDDQGPRPYNNYRGQPGESYQHSERRDFRERAPQRNGPPQYHEREHGYRRHDNDRPYERNRRGYERPSEERPFRDGQRFNRPDSRPQNRPGNERPAFRRGPENRSNDAYQADDSYNRRDTRYRDAPRNGYDRRNARDTHEPYNGREEFSRNGRQFEGDYEGLSTDEGFHPVERSRGGRFRGEQRPDRNTPDREERRVTRLPDGRVLKGPRSAQRKNAEFWTEVDQETEELVQQVHPPVHEEQAEDRRGAQRRERQAEDAAPTRTGRPAPARKPTRHVASAARRKQAATKAPDPSGAVLRPSQRGFKWPTP